MKDLGYANGWRTKTPEIVEKCDKAGHKKEYPESYQRCVTIVCCRKCGYQFKIDSSD
jgi:hypothetical protein